MRRRMWMSLGPTRLIRIVLLVVALLLVYLSISALTRGDWLLAAVPWIVVAINVGLRHHGRRRAAGPEN